MNKDRMKELIRAEKKLRALEHGGVDNWEFYDESMKRYREEIQEEEDKENFITELLETISGHIEEPAGRGCGYGVTEEGVNEIESFISGYYIKKLGE